MVDQALAEIAPDLHGPDDMVQLLTPEGVRRTDPDYPLDATPELLQGLYRDMALARRYDIEAMALQRQGELALWPPLSGQEGAQVGSARALGPDDVAFPSYREHAVALVRGLDPLAPLRLYRGLTHGGWDPAEHGLYLYTVVLGAQALHAVGYAQGLRRDGVAGAAVVYFGDGATSQGDTNEALVFAATSDAPVVFFCQNNQWAISTPVLRQSRVPLAARGSGFGIPSVRVDGNDVLACLAVTRAALARARDGGGPTFVEAVTYRLGPHTSSDDPTRYRLASELEAWKLRDPIERLKAHLHRDGLADAGFFTDVEAACDDLAARIRSGTLAMADPPVRALFADVYAEAHPLLAEEEGAFSAYQESFAEHG